jgi:hypothetical protein
MSVLDRFIDDIATAALATSRPGASKAEIARMKSDLSVREEVVSALFGMMFECLPDGKAEAFEEAVESGDDEKLDTFLSENLVSRPDMKTLVTRTAGDVAKKLGSLT